MVERTDAITNEVLEPITFVLAHLNVFCDKEDQFTVLPQLAMTHPLTIITISGITVTNILCTSTNFQPAILRLSCYVWLCIQTFL